MVCWACVAFAALTGCVDAVPSSFLSTTLGDHMVLQREPHQALVFGYAATGTIVTTNFDSKSYTTSSQGGIWRQRLPAMPASMTPYTLTFDSSNGDGAALIDVLFGDVYLCGGQSNMVYDMTMVTNTSEEIKDADNYPNIRLFTVGQNATHYDPFGVDGVEQPWTVASSKSLTGDAGLEHPFNYFSAVCWFFGRTLSDELAANGSGARIPIGLISSNWPGSRIEAHCPQTALDECGSSEQNWAWSRMIAPYTDGPMALTGFAWYQGEANANNTKSATDYACLFPAMITAWRKAFDNPMAYFGFVQIATFCWKGIAELREAQMSALKLGNIGYATNADYGDGCNVHPPRKQFCGKRLGNSALALQYGKHIHWKSPSYASAVASTSQGMATVTVTLLDGTDAGLTTDVYPANYETSKGEMDCSAQYSCVWASIQVSGAGWLNASVSVASSGRQLVLQAVLPSNVRDASILASSYGWGAVPMLNAYDIGSGLPVLPWKHALSMVV